MTVPSAYILCRFAQKSGIYNTWMEDAPIPCKVIDEYLPDWPLPDDAAIIITHMHYRWEEIHWLRKAYESSQVPILILADGILEYRNTWEHPDLAAGAIFQPVMGHKIACIGRSQARIVESWGNPGKCEIVGLPRFDAISVSKSETSTSEESQLGDRTKPFRLLIATANTPAFNEEQRQTVIESLLHIKSRLEANQKVNGRIAEVTWRLTDGLEREIGLPEIPSSDLPPLSEVLDGVDAVITTPSTLYLESIYRRKPTAILDFHNCPHYVNAAWFINAPKHFNWILSELEDPPPAKILFQSNVLADELECQTEATPRLYELIEAMVAAGKKARVTGEPLQLPARILEDAQHGFAAVSAEFDLSSLYPNEQAFTNQDVQRLQIELSQAIRRLESAPRELQEKTVHLSESLMSHDITRLRNSELHAKVVDLHERVLRLRKRLGIKRKPADQAKSDGNQV